MRIKKTKRLYEIRNARLCVCVCVCAHRHSGSSSRFSLCCNRNRRTSRRRGEVKQFFFLLQFNIQTNEISAYYYYYYYLCIAYHINYGFCFISLCISQSSCLLGDSLRPKAMREGFVSRIQCFCILSRCGKCDAPCVVCVWVYLVFVMSARLESIFVHFECVGCSLLSLMLALAAFGLCGCVCVCSDIRCVFVVGVFVSVYFATSNFD